MTTTQFSMKSNLKHVHTFFIPKIPPQLLHNNNCYINYKKKKSIHIPGSILLMYNFCTRIAWTPPLV